MDAVPTMIPIIDGVAEFTAEYDVWLCDIWGVMHNGEHAFAAANIACQRFRETGGTVILISNAPRPAPAVEAGFVQYGVAATAYDAIVTSGDVTRSLVEEARDRTVFHLGPERDRPIFERLDVTFAEPPGADLVVCSGLYDDTTETPEDYRELLTDLEARELPMICANPDLLVERGEELVYCAGSLAELYEQLGGDVVYSGKPHGPIYDLALKRAAELRGRPVARAAVLAVGDGVKTDIAGAVRARIDALYVGSGLHLGPGSGSRALDARSLDALFAECRVKPRAAIARLAW